MKASAPLAQLPFLSPASVSMLGRIGVESVGQLRALGAVDAFVRLRRSGEKTSLPLLYALEAGVCGSNITDITAARRAELVAVVSSQHDWLPALSSPSTGENIGKDEALLQRALGRTWPTANVS